ncbi:MAG: hypothetical protein FOGNACKC_00851 [Anaerolineae bacterium]|nr:hypothetical protein [Anaerolineae bacterium]
MNVVRKLGLKKGMTDLFCGGGGSTSGAKKAGAEVEIAVNHSKLALETHSKNHPDTFHVLTDVSTVNVRYFASTVGLWASPECTNHALKTKGKKRKAPQMSMFEPPDEDDLAAERSRATMWDVPRFTEHHRYEFIVVENVVDVTEWPPYEGWIQAMRSLGYEHKEVFMNAMFVNPVNGVSSYAPQSRNRIYIVFWRRGNKAPDLDFRPWAWCEQCGQAVQAEQVWKPGRSRGQYGERNQYVYCCPNGCMERVKRGVKNIRYELERKQVVPYYYSAWNAIDWTNIGERIGDRDKPLKPNTIRRIELGLEKYSQQPLIVPMAYTHGNHDRSIPMIRPLPGQTTTQNVAIAVPQPFLAKLYGQSTVQSIEEALGVITAGGRNYAVISAAPFLQHYYTRDSAHSGIEEPLATISTNPRFGLVMPQPFLTPYYGTGGADSIEEPVGTLPTKARYNVVVPGDKLTVEDCYFRMMTADETKVGMGFDQDYILLGTQEMQVKLAGNAVCPPKAELLVQRCLASLDG